MEVYHKALNDLIYLIINNRVVKENGGNKNGL